MFGHSREDVDGESGGFRHIDGAELHPAVHEVRDEGHGSREPVELGDEERRALAPTEIERAGKLRPIRSLAALDLAERASKLPTHPFNVPENGLALRVQSKTGAALAVGGNAVIGDEKRFGMRFHGVGVKRQRSL